MTKLSYNGVYVINEQNIEFHNSLVLDYIDAKNVTLSEIDTFKPFQLFGCDYYSFTCKVYDAHRNVFNVFSYQNGHYAKLRAPDYQPYPYDDCFIDDWNKDNLVGYSDHCCALQVGLNYESPVQRYSRLKAEKTTLEKMYEASKGIVF